MSSLNPSLIQVGSFKWRAGVPLYRNPPSSYNHPVATTVQLPPGVDSLCHLTLTLTLEILGRFEEDSREILGRF